MEIDIAKQVVQLHGADRGGCVVHRAKASRGSLFESVRTLKPRLVVMEACSSAHHWARRFQSLGTEVRLISPLYVAPFVKTNKNDRNDAEVNVEAASRATMRFVPVKSVKQQDVQATHRMGAILLRHHTELINQMRGLSHAHTPKEVPVGHGYHALGQPLHAGVRQKHWYR
jgi:transposase